MMQFHSGYGLEKQKLGKGFPARRNDPKSFPAPWKDSEWGPKIEMKLPRAGFTHTAGVRTADMCFYEYCC